jgi:late competence protein required for DNA uptake (superfamily II DNA/RNA helicase)
MPENRKNIKMRCPVCLGRENDVVLWKTENSDYYCPKCSFTGTEAETRAMYADYRKKYRFLTKRLTLKKQELL